MKDFIRNGLAVVGAAYLVKTVGGFILDRYKDDILDYVADSLVDYISEEGDEEKTTTEKLKKKLFTAYLRKGASK